VLGYLSLLEKAAFLITAKDYSTLASVLKVINSRAAVDVMAVEHFASCYKKFPGSSKTKKFGINCFIKVCVMRQVFMHRFFITFIGRHW
jgi:hypothetical protein